MVMRTCPPVLLAASLLLGGGCGGSVEPIEVGPLCPGQPLRGPDQYVNEPLVQLIDDFESGDRHLALEGGRDGYWVLGTDFSSGKLIDEVSMQCTGRDLWAGHFAARGFTSWGNNWTGVFRATTGNSATPYDGRAYGGISFWAAFGGDNGPDFAVPFGVTTMDNAWNGGICTTACQDFYGTTVALTHDWRRYEIRFDTLAQSGWGSPQVPMRLDQLVGFIIWPRQQFDIWIDDLRFEL
jgi:hypothetical protein